MTDDDCDIDPDCDPDEDLCPKCEGDGTSWDGLCVCPLCGGERLAMMTDQELRAIRERERKATKGPWEVSVPWNKKDRAYVVHHDTEFKDADVFSQGGSLSAGGHARLEDAVFTAHARQDIPALLAEVDRLRAELAAVKPPG